MVFSQFIATIFLFPRQQLRAQLLTYYQPSPLLWDLSQAAPGESADSFACQRVSCRSPPLEQEEDGGGYRTDIQYVCLFAALVNDGGPAIIDPC